MLNFVETYHFAFVIVLCVSYNQRRFTVESDKGRQPLSRPRANGLSLSLSELLMNILIL